MTIFNSVFKSFYKWKPWANTLAYYTFNNTLNDSSWNNRNLTWTWSFVGGWPWKVYQVTSAYADDNVFNINWTNPFTLNIWVKFTQFPSSNDVVMWMWKSDNVGYHDKEIDIYSWWVVKAQMWDWSEYSLTSNTNVSLDVWYNIVFVFTGSNRYLYINNNLVASGSWWSSRNLGENRLWFRKSWDWQFQISNAILENIWWDTTAVSDYFNWTKAIYWIS